MYDLTRENAQVLAEYATPGNAVGHTKGATDEASNTAAPGAPIAARDARNVYTYTATGRQADTAQGARYVTDGRGSVSEILDNTGKATACRYDPYGNMQTGAPKQERVWGYNGEQYTPQTGLQYLRARNYKPQTGSFLTWPSGGVSSGTVVGPWGGVSPALYYYNDYAALEAEIAAEAARRAYEEIAAGRCRGIIRAL